MQCPGCGFECQPEFAFCPKCGSLLGAPWGEPALEGDTSPLAERLQRLLPREFTDQLLAAGEGVSHERRTVTMLFCDIKGSTAMAESLDPEDVLEIMNGAFDVLIEPVVRYEGTLARLMGDAILAFFGAPVTHEDDPERACRAALEILHGAQAYAARLERERGIRGFNVRVGIHTGLVVVGEVGSDLRAEYTAMGDAVNLAARMEQAAEPGTVLISEATHKLVAPLFEMEALGPVAVKGKAEAVPVYRVLAAVEGAAKPRGIAGLASPLVGREAEFAALTEALACLQEGEGGVATIVGEAGIGKSRLVAELRKQVDVRGGVVGAQHAAPLQATDGVGAARAHSRAPLRWVEGRCLSYGASLAYQVWLDVLRALLGVTLDELPDVVDRVLREQIQSLCPGESDAVYPFLARLLSLPLDRETADRLDELDGQSLQEGTFSAVETLLAYAARRQPLIVVCEDLHWADPTSLQLLERLLPLTGRLPLLLLCVSRPVQEHRVWELLQTIAREHGAYHTDLVLRPLSEEEGQTLVRNLLWVDELPSALKERILSRAEGNPFYLEEILRTLIDQGAIVQDEASGLWRAELAVEALHIPETLEGVLVARIDRLPEGTRRVLQLASVIGRVFLYRILAEITPAVQEGQRLDRRLERLEREDLIRERARLPEVEYSFKHDLTREAAYNGLLKRDRVVYHQQVGEALEQLYPERLEEQLGLLAYHWEQAGVADKAVDYMQRAGDQARLAYALEEAVDYYERALALQREGKQRREAARTLMKLGLTHQNAFQFQRSQEAYDEGFDLWRQVSRERPVDLPPAPHALKMVAFHTGSPDPAFDMDLPLYLFSGLVDLTPDDNILPDVAHRWEVRDGGLTYFFYLRDDVRWSDGLPVTAHDFEFGWKRVLDPDQESPFANMLHDIKGARAYHLGEESDPDTVGVRARDDHTLVVELESPIAYLLPLLANSATFPVPEHTVNQWGEAWIEPAHFVSNGPFRLEARQAGQFANMVRNPTYHGQFSGNVERVEAFGRARLGDRDVVDMYEADEIDLLYLGPLSPSEIVRAQRRNASDYVKIRQWAAVFFLAFNVTRPPFDDVRVRRALVQALDIESIDPYRDIPEPAAMPGGGGFIPVGMPGHSPGLALPHDPGEARRLLAEAGYPGGRGLPQIACISLLGRFDQDRRDLLLPQWKDHLGVEVEYARGGWRDALQRAEDGSPFLFLAFFSAVYLDPDCMLRLSFPWELTGYGAGEYRDLVERAGRTADQEKRMELYSRADRLLIEDAVVMPFEYGGHWWLIKPWVTRFPCATALKAMFWKDIVIELH